MSQSHTAAMPNSLGTSKPRTAPRFGTAIAELWHGLMKDLFDSYRPELHYMRGPGPKWREKHPF